MTIHYQDKWITILHGDCREMMKSLADCSVDSIVTDPPYELGFMGKGWDRSGIAYDVSVWLECLRVLKPGGYLLAFGGSRTYHRLACAIEDAGFEIRDQIQWIYGSGFPKSLDVSKAIDAAAGATRERVGSKIDLGVWHSPKGQAGQGEGWQRPWMQNPDADAYHVTVASTDAAKQWNGWGTALKPAHEPIVVARKPLAGTVAANVLEHGTGGLNIDACRIGVDIVGWQGDPSNGFSGGLNSREPNGRPVEGRWPANVIHDGSEEVLAGFPDDVGANGGNGQFEQHTWMRQQSKQMIERSKGSAARFFYCAKASGADREEGLDSPPVRSAGDVTDRKDGSDGLNSPRAGAGRTNGSRNHHPTVKPTALMRYLCRLVTPPKGTVLDPFCGSGSTGKAAALEGFKSILIDIDAQYCELAANRAPLAQEDFFSQ